MKLFLHERESVSMGINNSPSKLTAIIVDDELLGRENLKKIIETYCHEVEVLGTADSAVSAKKLVQLHNPEVVFLDINMPLLDGFDFLGEYNKRSFQVVFVTAHAEFAIKAVKEGVADYILKPVEIKELKQTVKKLLMVKDQQSTAAPTEISEKIIIPTSNGFNVLDVDDIIRLEAEGCYTHVIVKEGKKAIVSRTLKDFEETIPKENFFRVHKSHLINLKYIRTYSSKDGRHVLMTDGSKIEVSRRRITEFTQKIKRTLNSI